jgi:ubiquinone/menaquinone biosynthesis C-methylase UbiE
MARLGKIVALAAAATVAALVGWRLAARRRSLPCPPWLGWLLENPITEAVGGRQILDYLDVRPGMKLLDAGCGPGRLTVPAAQRVGSTGEVWGLDIQPEMVRRARLKAEAAGVENIRFVGGGLGDGLLPRDTFDRAMLVTVLGEIPDRAAALAEIAQALRPGGRLAITEVLPDPHFQRLATVRALTSAAGLRELTTFGRAFRYTMIVERSG